MKRVLLLMAIIGIGVLPSWGQSGTTLVTAKVVDTGGTVYVNCQWSVVFVGQNTTPGAGPYSPAPLLNGQQGNCDSQGNFTINLADNINTVAPTPSQWSFSICSAGGYLGGPFCKANMLITITGATQNISAILTPLMPLLPTGGGGGGNGLSGMVAGQVPIAASPTFVTSSMPLAGAGAGITTGPTSGVTSGDVTDYTGTGGQITDSGIATTNLVTAAANYTSGDLVQAAASSRATSDSGVATTNLVTAASNFTSGHIPKAAASNKTLTDGYSVQGFDSALLTAGTVSGTSVPLCTDANGGATTVSCPTGGGGAPGGATNSVQFNNGSGFGGTSIPGVNGSFALTQTVTGGVAGFPVFSLPGVPVDATNPVTLLYTDRASYLPWTSGTALALPAVTGNFAVNYPFVLQNTAGSTLTFTPNAGALDLIDGSATATLLNKFASFVYQDATAAPGHWFTIKFPTFAAFGSNCTTALTWSTTTGVGCQVSSATSPNLYTEATSAGVTTNSASSAPVNMFTGYTIPASTLSAGHRLVARACFRHTTGSTGTTYNWVIGGSIAIAIASGSTATTQFCSTLEVFGITNTTQELIQTLLGASVSTPTQGSSAYTLSNTNTINVTQTAAGTADVYTAYSLTVDLF